MAEPATLTTAAVAGSVAVGLTGSFLGVDYDVLLAGFLAGIIVVASREDAKPLAAAIGILVAVIVSAFFAAPIAVWQNHYNSVVPLQLMRPMIAFIVGYLAQDTLLPAIKDFFKWGFGKLKKVLGQKIDEVAK